MTAAVPRASSPRARRLAETIKRLVGEWLEQEHRAERMGFVTVTDVRVRGDLRLARVWYTVLGDEPERAAAEAALAEGAGSVRSFVAQRLRLRFAPQLEFAHDDAAAHGARIDALLASLAEPGGDAGAGAGPGGEQPAP